MTADVRVCFLGFFSSQVELRSRARRSRKAATVRNATLQSQKARAMWPPKHHQTNVQWHRSVSFDACLLAAAKSVDKAQQNARATKERTSGLAPPPPGLLLLASLLPICSDSRLQVNVSVQCMCENKPCSVRLRRHYVARIGVVLLLWECSTPRLPPPLAAPLLLVHNKAGT